MTPIASGPLFVGLTASFDKSVQRKLALRSVLIAFAIIAAFTVGGRTILSAFALVCFITWVTFTSGEAPQRVPGQNPINVATA